MNIVLRFWAIFVIAIKRILSQPWMALATTLGMILAVSLSMSVPLYASTVYNRVFLSALNNIDQVDTLKKRPPFSILFTFDSNIYGNLQIEDAERMDSFMRDRAAAITGLPTRLFVHYYATNPLAIFPASVDNFSNERKPLIWSSLSTLSDLESHVTVLEGTYPSSALDGPIEALISEPIATELGLQVGEIYNMFARDQMIDGVKTTLTIPVRISGVYQAADPDSEYWFIRPELFKEQMMVSETTFAKRLGPLLSDDIYGSFWYLLADGTSVRPENALQMAGRIQGMQRQAEQVLPRVRLSISPAPALIAYQRAANLLTVLLFAFSVPIFGLLLAFISMTAGMTVERQRNEIAVLRSRGAMLAQMVGIAAVEGLVLGGLALLISLPLSAGIAQVIGRTRSFLDFSGSGALDGAPVGLLSGLAPSTLYFGLGAIALTLIARLLPTVQAARDTIVLYKRERARSLRAPLWQRMGLDLLLLIPAGYGIYLLRQQGSIDPLNASASGDPFANPLLMMVPALAIFALTLLFLRLLPFVMRFVAWTASHTRSVGLLMAARHLARTPATYTLPLVLLILTLSLSAFTATLAGTLDHHLHDQIYYKTGADAHFTDLGDSPIVTAPPGIQGMATDADSQPGWLFLPVSEYTRLPGVEDATRVGLFEATALFGGRFDQGKIMGVDRYNLPAIAFWREDFARDSLGELMNRLAQYPDGLLVQESFMATHGLNMTELVTVRVIIGQKVTEMDFHVVGTFNLFPTYYPGEGPLMVANLDYLFQEAGGAYPYQVWLKTSNPADIVKLNRDATNAIGARTISWEEPNKQISAQQARPERQGLFGVLSVGFGAAALLTVLGFLLYALLSYQRRFVELGVLRAVGLSAGQMVAFLAAELAFLILTGAAIGTGLGVWISNLFIPYLQIGGADPSAKIPPYLVYVAWPAILRVYGLFGALFVIALVGLVILLSRMQIFKAIKMGESL